MKQYLHTIMRSLCIMVMLCGISNGAWAQSDWSDILQLENQDCDEEGNPIPNSYDNPYLISSSDWESFVYNIQSGASIDGVYFKLSSDIELESAPTYSLDITSTNLEMNSYTITVGSEGNPLPVDFSSFKPVFSEDSGLDADYVTYCLGVTSANWQSFTTNYKTLIARGNVKFALVESLYLKEAPLTPLDITSDYFTMTYGITVGDEGGHEVSPWVVDFSSYEFSPVFSESDFENNVTYHFSITNANWDSFTEIYSDFVESYDNVRFKLEEDIYTTNVPDSPLEIAYEKFNTNNYVIIAGDYENPLEDIDFDNFPKIFSDSDYFGSSEKYYVKVTTDNMEAAVSYSSSASNIYKVLGDGVDLSSDDLKNTIEGGARFYINITDGNKEDVISLYNSLEVTDENFKPVLVLGEGVTISELGLDSGVNYYFSITKSNWDALVHEYNVLFPKNEWNGSTDKEGESNVYFVLDNYIDFDKLPIETLKIYPDNILFEFTGNDGNLTVGKTNPVSYQAPILPIMTYGHGDGDYYFKAEAETWDALTEYFSSQDNMFLVMTNNITLDSEPTTQLSIDLNHFISNGYKIIIPEVWDIFSDADMNAAYVSGAEVIEISDNSSWNDFVAAYNLGNVKDNTLVKITNNIEIGSSDNIPNKPISLKVTFDSGSITVGTDPDSGTPVKITSRFNRLFSDPSTDNQVNYYLIINDQEGIERVARNLEDFRGTNVSLYIDQNEDEGDYDLSKYTFDSETQSLSITSRSDEEITIKLSYQSEGYPFPEEEGKIKYVKGAEPVTDPLAEELLNALLGGAVKDSSLQGPGYNSIDAETLVGSGTQESPYQIYSYKMLAKLVEIVNSEAENYTSGKYFKLGSDINMQGNERLTDLNGNASNTTPTLQFTNFKGYLDGDKHSIGGMTCPLFANLNGATIEKLGIVDCKMAGHALAASATNSTVTMSYVSGVSLGLISETNNTVTNCYAYNTSTKATTPYNITAGTTTRDASDTHDILVGNCYTLSPIDTDFDATDIYTDCTLFVPTNNTIYKYSDGEYASSYGSDGFSTYMSYIKWGSESEGAKWIETPHKSNVCLLHNVLYDNYWGHSDGSFPMDSGYGGLLEEDLEHYINYLYSWYIVDKKAFNKTDDLQNSRIKNIYYSRGSGAYDGLNTIYLPFAWDPSNDLYDKDGEKITDAKVYILADKLNDNKEFSDDADYTDYTQESTLLFFQPSNGDFAKVSNGLPTILKIPEGNTGWYIKRDKMAHYATRIADNCSSYNYNPVNNYTYDNIYDRYWGTGDYETYDRSFMDINSLNTDYTGRAFHLGTFTELTKHTEDEDGNEITPATFGAGTFGDYKCYKLNSAGTGMASVTSKSSVQPFRTFVAIAPGTSGAKASYKLGFCGIFDIEDTPTEIDGVATEGIKLMTTAQSRVYSIDGRYVGQYGNKKLAPGMYIMNGKKFVVK